MDEYDTEDLQTVALDRKSTSRQRYMRKYQPFKIKMRKLPPGKFKELIAAQGGGCAACGRVPGETRGMGRDHHHLSGEERGIICTNCNFAIGFLNDDPERCRKLAAYLDRYKSAVPSAGV